MNVKYENNKFIIEGSEGRIEIGENFLALIVDDKVKLQANQNEIVEFR